MKNNYPQNDQNNVIDCNLGLTKPENRHPDYVPPLDVLGWDIYRDLRGSGIDISPEIVAIYLKYF